MDEAAWAEETLQLRPHEISDEAEYRTIISLKPTLMPTNSGNEEDSDL